MTADKALPYSEHVFGTKQETESDASKTVQCTTERLGPIAHMRQVHGTRIVQVKTPGLVEEADAMFTDEKGLWLAVKTADCVPVLISSPAAVGVAHCGWRGLQGGLLPSLIATMRDEYYIDPLDMYIHIGPCISAKYYEVDESFLNEFDAKFFSPSTNKGKLMMDVGAIARAQAIESNIPDLNIYNSGLCTFEQKNLFHSYRRAKKQGDQNYRVQLSLVRRAD